VSARDDFMAVRRAAHFLGTIAQGESSDPVTCWQQVLAKASAREIDFIRLAKAGIQDEMIDLAYAILTEDRPGGPAVVDTGRSA
jgi:hypothetical protein